MSSQQHQRAQGATYPWQTTSVSLMKPSSPKNRFDGFTTDTVTCLFCNSGFASDTDQFHHRHQQFHHRHRVLNLAGTGDAPKGDGDGRIVIVIGKPTELGGAQLTELDAWMAKHAR
jgi:hypothetical protein